MLQKFHFEKLNYSDYYSGSETRLELRSIGNSKRLKKDTSIFKIKRALVVFQHNSTNEYMALTNEYMAFSTF